MPRNVICIRRGCNRWITSRRIKDGHIRCSKCQRKTDAERKARQKQEAQSSVDTKFVNEVKELVEQNKDIEHMLSKVG